MRGPLMMMRGPAKAGYAEEVLADNPTAYWRLDETTGTTLVDVLGVHNGTYDNLPALGSAPLINAGTAVIFDGVDQTGTIPHHTDLNGAGTNPLTVEMWVRVETPTADARYVFVDKTGSSSANGQWGIWYENRSSQGSPRRLRAFTADAAQVDWEGQATFDAVSAGGHLVCVFEPPPVQRYRMYWNGTEVAVETRQPAYLSGNVLPVRLAGLATSGGFGNVTLDEVAIYNGQALSPERIAAHYAAGKQPAGSLEAKATYIGTVSTGPTSTGTVTFTDVPIGDAAAGRTVVLGFTGYDTNSPTVTLTVNGNTATLDASAATRDGSSVHRISVASGTTATVVATANTGTWTPRDCYLHVWTFPNAVSVADALALANTTPSGTITVPYGGTGIVTAISRYAYTLTGADVLDYNVTAGNMYRKAGRITTPGDATVEISNGDASLYTSIAAVAYEGA